MIATPARATAPAAAHAEPCLKRFYVGLYCEGLLTKAALIALFRQHPEWRAA